MKKKILFSIFFIVIFLFSTIIFGFLISDANECWNLYKEVKSDASFDETILQILLTDYLNGAIKYTVLCALEGVIICLCLAMLIIVLKSDIDFIHFSFLERRAANKVRREEELAQEESRRKAARISELEKELNELKKGGE